ncbi:MAG: hypothetical protein K2Q13_02900 [Nitrosomonas sp.]|uniref:hypothetical protein n=1 Tax=Nitrosomonas sp. TaxID=42353 RepID=UPI0025D3CE2F|nr:hypothetical protein [Nitrosomonas sp.]MBY0473992.1 hypothetical protein [Nitrosomonas sp.]
MGTEHIAAILKKATTDDVFRLALAKDLNKTLDAHNIELTKAEMDALKSVNFKKPLFTDIGGAAAASWVHVYS